MDNGKKRNCLYPCFVFGEHGTLGRRNRIRIPECVVTFIRSLCPDENNNYTGFRDVDEDGNGAPNESVQGGNINFEAGERVKICISFDNIGGATANFLCRAISLCPKASKSP